MSAAEGIPEAETLFHEVISNAVQQARAAIHEAVLIVRRTSIGLASREARW